MANLPAFCDNCGTAFPSGFQIDNATNITFIGNRVGPCPKCGGMGHIPDGVFNIVGSAIEIIRAPNRTLDELRRLSEILELARQNKESPKAVAEQVEKELPAMSALMALIPENQANWLAFITLILTIIQMLLPMFSGDDQKNTQAPQITINQVIQQTIVNGASPPSPIVRKDRKVGRNEACTCGSGKKYKKCCGALK